MGVPPSCYGAAISTSIIGAYLIWRLCRMIKTFLFGRTHDNHDRWLKNICIKNFLAGGRAGGLWLAEKSLIKARKKNTFSAPQWGSPSAPFWIFSQYCIIYASVPPGSLYAKNRTCFLRSFALSQGGWGGDEKLSCIPTALLLTVKLEEIFFMIFWLFNFFFFYEYCPGGDVPCPLAKKFLITWFPGGSDNRPIQWWLWMIEVSWFHISNAPVNGIHFVFFILFFFLKRNLDMKHVDLDLATFSFLMPIGVWSVPKDFFFF